MTLHVKCNHANTTFRTHGLTHVQACRRTHTHKQETNIKLPIFTLEPPGTDDVAIVLLHCVPSDCDASMLANI